MSDQRVYPSELMPLANRDQTRLVELIASRGSIEHADWMHFPATELLKREVINSDGLSYHDGAWFEEYMLHQSMAQPHLLYSQRVATRSAALEKLTLSADGFTAVFKETASQAQKLTVVMTQLALLMEAHQNLAEAYEQLEALVESNRKAQQSC